jgi:hypothetical protein
VFLDNSLVGWRDPCNARRVWRQVRDEAASSPTGVIFFKPRELSHMGQGLGTFAGECRELDVSDLPEPKALKMSIVSSSRQHPSR